MNQSNYDQLKQTLAPERIEAYGTSSDSPEIIFARYLLNMALCESLYSPLQFAEIALRNSIHQQLSAHHDTTEWYRFKEGLTPWQQKRISESISSLQTHAKPVTAGRVVAELTFGFWTSFFNKTQAQTSLSQSLVTGVFSHLARRQRTLKRINNRWNRIRDLRNRIFHHERIIHWKDLDQQHTNLVEAIYWISPELAQLSKTLDRYTQIRKAGLQPWLDKINL